MHFHFLSPQTIQQKNYIWEVSNINAFDELLISWNAYRPSHGHYTILSRVLIKERWSSWLLYAVWGSKEQFSFHDFDKKMPVCSFQDQLEVLNGETASGFSIRLETCGGASLHRVRSLHACTSRANNFPSISLPLCSYTALKVPKISQFCFPHPRSHSLCSPISTTAVIRYLLPKSRFNPLSFANQVYDAGFDIYGNWPFNVAQAFVELGDDWLCFCCRLTQFNWFWQNLKKGIPVVISIKGSIPGAPFPYLNGHLIVIKGYHAMNQQFSCIDPAFPSNDQTEIFYPCKNLIEAWKNRRYLTYLFFRKES